MLIVSAFKELLSEKARYKVFYGGRGGAKSENFARALLVIAMERKVRILCTREYQITIKDSVHKLLSDLINSYPLTLAPCFSITSNAIKCVATGSEFIFKGLHHNIQEIKSMQGINYCWVEEAANVSKDSWMTLIPTIREENSEIWISFNPVNETDPTYEKFVKNCVPESIVKQVSWRDNPFFPITLEKERQHCLANFPEDYDHIWEGKPKNISDAVVFKGKFEISDFDIPENVQWKLGADWGFANDPSTLVACFIHNDNLFIRYEAYGHGVEIRELGEFFKPVMDKVGSRWVIMADNSRPETISDVNRYSGYLIKPARKWPGSLADGVEFIRGKFNKIVIHPECRHTAQEFRLYSYRIDKITGEIMPIIIDAYNHCIDPVRYALDGFITGKSRNYEAMAN